MAAADKSFDGRLIVLEKNPIVDALLLGAIPVGLLGFVAFLAFHQLGGVLGIHVAVISAALRFGVARQNSLARPRERTIHAGPEGLTADGVLFPRKRIVDGRYQPRAAVQRSARKRPAGSTVQLFDRAKRIIFEAEVDTEEEGVAILRALGLDASQRRAEFRAASPIGSSQTRGALFALAALGALAGARLVAGGGLLLFVLIAMPLIVLMTTPSKIIVGVDGVLTRWLGRKRFYPMGQIVSAEADGETRIVLRLACGKTETLYTSTAKRYGGIYTQHRDMILARIREAQASHRQRRPGADVATLVARGARTAAEWKTALTSLAQADAGYRQAAIREEDLWRVVEDPRAAPDARAGAARLLRSGLDDEGKARVRVAAEATASPKLRIALEAASEGSEDAIEDALDALAQEKHP